MRNFNKYILLLLLPSALLLWGCSSSRHLPQGSYLLDKVKIDVNDTTNSIEESEMMNYLRQIPNHKILWTMKMQLGIYNLSGRDTTKWYNRWIRKMGEAPVVYDHQLTENSAEQLRKAMVNKGFLHASVNADTLSKGRKMRVAYHLQPGEPHRISTISYRFPNDSLRNVIMADSSHFTVQEGDLLDRTRLESQRDVITANLRNKGYYGFTKDFVTFEADTTEGSKDVALTVVVNPPYPSTPGGIPILTHTPYYIRDIKVIEGYDNTFMGKLSEIKTSDSLSYKSLDIFYNGKLFLRPSLISDNCFLRKGKPFDAGAVERTYTALSRLEILKFSNIRFLPVAEIDGKQWLDAYILLTPTKSKSVSLELEGTNSEGDLGVAVGISFSHRNIFKGSETFTAKFRGAYESISGNLSGFIHNRYMEYSLDLGLSFPKFEFPFLKDSFKRKIMASTDINVSMNYQERPEYTRIISTAGWSYKWTERSNRMRHTVTPIDINYVYLPESTNNFIDQIAPDNPLLRYSYEDHFIMRLGYSFYYTNKKPEQPWTRSSQKNISTIRVNTELAGNLLFAINSIFTHRSDFHTDPYKIFGIRYSQYFKAEADYGFLHIFDHRQSIALHAGFGIGVPYGNSSILPFEKRFYGGGANGVRGWAVRTLGPGSYAGQNSVTDFINQCGDIRLELSAEYRAKLFWVVELGIFVDAGNIWTIRDYETQPGGLFRFNEFYKQIAAAYGVGLRLDFKYFLLRFDLGMKAHNPAKGEEPWPIFHPHWGRDRTFHFSIGYPF